MIYLIDDKKLRQGNDFGWSDEKFNRLKDSIQPIYDLGELEKRSAEIFQNGNIILYHESFLDNTSLKHQASFKRDRLDKFIQKNDKSLMAFFSGSKDIRGIDNRIAYLPVSVLYENLEIFIDQQKSGNNDLLFLLYGNNPYIEQKLIGMLDMAIANIDNDPASLHAKSNLFVSTDEKFIDNPIVDVDEQTLYFEETDEQLNELIHEWLGEKEYNNIFIPLCFGSSLSDFNGLRLATHIRCTQTQNQFANIFIYSFVGIEYLLNNPFFNILKTENVHLVDFKKAAFQKVANEYTSEIKINNFSQELLKLKLTPPGNYYDSHSIANEWSILRWSELILTLKDGDDKPEEIEIIENQIKSNIYYKYLQCIYPIQEQFTLTLKDLKLNHTGKLLYIDDEIEKGWHELFRYIFWDQKINKIEYFDSIGGDFKKLDKKEIIHNSIEKAKDFDVVILDFRLTQDDFYQNDPEEISGYKILEGIKSFNKGIQVIIFSASNKIWNLQALQDAGADGFIIKESPENSVDPNFTSQSVKNIIQSVESCLEKKYLKQIEILKSSIEKSFSLNPLTKYYPNDFRILRGLQYQNLLLTELTSISDILSSKNENRLNHAMLMQFKIIECIIEIFIPEKNSGKWTFWDNTELQYFYLEDKRLYKSNVELSFFDSITQRKKVMKIPQYEYNSSRNKIDCLIEQKIDLNDKIDIHKQIKELINYRNSFIHPKDRLTLKTLSSAQILKWMDLINKIIIKI
jgi:CheY-like chemotaxis protein